MKKAKENWIGEQCNEIEENLRKNNSKRARKLVKDLTTVKQGKATTVQDRSGKCLYIVQVFRYKRRVNILCLLKMLIKMIHKKLWTSLLSTVAQDLEHDLS